mmetsp:Transcript_48309/g.65750  ORF Transcript_48309/g.65750 Transcript_48309/m.65750 type:complete len:248 (-) Transcript_48309:303-1046(-)
MLYGESGDGLNLKVEVKGEPSDPLGGSSELKVDHADTKDAKNGSTSKQELYLENFRKQIDRQMERVRDRPYLASWLYEMSGVTIPHPTYDDSEYRPLHVEPEQLAVNKLLNLRCEVCAHEKLKADDACWNEACVLSPIHCGYMVNEDDSSPDCTVSSLSFHPILNDLTTMLLQAPFKVLERPKRKREECEEVTGGEVQNNNSSVQGIDMSPYNQNTPSPLEDPATYRWQLRRCDSYEKGRERVPPSH